MGNKILPIPDFFDAQAAQAWSYSPRADRLMAAAADFRRSEGINPSQTDLFKILLLLIDPQLDFCHRSGALYVGGRSGDGAVQDSLRTAQFIYRCAAQLTQIAITGDLHSLYQCFFVEFWLLANGQPPAPHTLIGLHQDQLVNIALNGQIIGPVQPNPAITSFVFSSDYDQLVKQMKYYVRELKRCGKYALYLWPHHCLEGSEGQRIVGPIQEAVLYHSFLRHSPAYNIHKGRLPLTEYYSVFGPEVGKAHDGRQLSDTDQRVQNFLWWVNSHDAVIIAGQASSHCVSASVQDIAEHVQPGKLGKYYLLTDCMSPVVVPGGADFTEAADQALWDFEQRGMHLVQSTTPMDKWPDFPMR
ncbi:nicotinamidase [Patescibacteria group bacterium]|nr:nicotinamidase [Patescibacteria group bacterium]MBU1916177.1 nicotinamidase [Patescibacteria group bacterium]